MITKRVLLCSGIIESRTGRKPILYSRAQWVNDHLNAKDLAGHDWWLAQYLAAPNHEKEHPGPPTLPKDVKTWLIHQTGDRIPAFGVTGSKTLDHNRWNGSKEDVYAYAKKAPAKPPAEKPEEKPAVGERLRFRVAVPILNIREGPGMQYKDIGNLRGGEIVEAIGIGGNGAWIEFSPGKWCAVQVGITQYLLIFA